MKESMRVSIESIDFEKANGLVPTVVCDAGSGVPRMLAYSNRESLALALSEDAGIYWSRSRARLWRKGEESGNSQRLVSVAVDCDRDTLLFYVDQKGATCHLGGETCFEESAPFSWATLAARVRERASGAGAASYTRTLLADAGLLDAKLREEAAEVGAAQTRDDVAWECADLLYFMTVKMHGAGVGIADVLAQLERRAK
jgi:phosphoribosyl-ATP pyrophosphohydrolase